MFMRFFICKLTKKSRNGIINLPKQGQLFFAVMQKAAFRVAKGHLLPPERPSTDLDSCERILAEKKVDLLAANELYRL